MEISNKYIYIKITKAFLLLTLGFMVYSNLIKKERVIYMSVDIPECRICFDIETYDDPFITPCSCKGTSKYVHKSCLNTWRHFNREGLGWKQCMECKTEYSTRYKYPVENTKIFPITYS